MKSFSECRRRSPWFSCTRSGARRCARRPSSRRSVPLVALAFYRVLKISANSGLHHNDHRGRGLLLRFQGRRTWRSNGLPSRRGGADHPKWTDQRLRVHWLDTSADRYANPGRIAWQPWNGISLLALGAGVLSLLQCECDNFVLMKSSRIGFVGVGRMGANMARRLHEMGHPVVAIYDANAAMRRSWPRNWAPRRSRKSLR